MTDISTTERQRLADHLRATGRDPLGFTVDLQPDGLVRVTGPRGTAFYSRENWFDRFTRHLDKSFFDPQVPAPAGPRITRKQASAIST